MDIGTECTCVYTHTLVLVAVSVRQGREAALIDDGDVPSERIHTPASLEASPELCTLTSSCLAGRDER